MKKATGWDARDAGLQGHRAIVTELDETNEGGLLHFRWECVCRRNGKWVASVVTAEARATAHERRGAPRPSKRSNAARLINDAIGLRY